jgi:membrane-associated protein
VTNPLQLLRDLPAWLGEIDPMWIYVVVAMFVFLETSAFLGFLVPGETAAIFAGVLTRTDDLSLPLLLAILPVCAVLGDSAGYLIGRAGGPAVLQMRLVRRTVRPEHVRRAHGFLERHGIWAVPLGRWVGFLRAGLPVIAGTARMPYAKFLPGSAIGAITWSWTCLIGGYLAATSWEAFSDRLSMATALFAGTITAAVVVIVLVWRWRSERAQGSGTEP